jgi:hypothetical protein
LISTADLFSTDCELPRVYIDFDAIGYTGILERHKAAALEISDLLDGFIRRRAEATYLLGALKGKLLAENLLADGNFVTFFFLLFFNRAFNV